MTNRELIEKFYTSFADGNAKGMASCYHDDVIFRDEVFGTLQGNRACKMWEMLLSGKAEPAKISFNNIEATLENGSANWKAEYFYGAKKRKVINNIKVNFKFKEGKIIEHIDSFNLWKWTQQALGPVGYLMGWTPFMKNKIQKTTNQKLDHFIAKK
ncbi:nuclear transport factor 2 family protein [Tamlana agarivorans]|uniref:Nuclear transport factor 2 family protein n=1 Tax=Pseudotamlana agarivorans TaxID=481183 RepID=A0ACC5UAS8_9FLAO|nr:nuclear transport factor 2 family protein [Tamlana agarivorans]MBU2951349.1 nuclear transport factor 2 family protein [Tamlana agarivorans]